MIEFTEEEIKQLKEIVIDWLVLGLSDASSLVIPGIKTKLEITSEDIGVSFPEDLVPNVG